MSKIKFNVHKHEVTYKNDEKLEIDLSFSATYDKNFPKHLQLKAFIAMLRDDIKSIEVIERRNCQT